MAVRYSGDVVVRVVWSDRYACWKCGVSTPGRRVSIEVGRAPDDRELVDSPRAYDSAARAAISFADAAPRPGGRDFAADCCWGPMGPIVWRDRRLPTCAANGTLCAEHEHGGATYTACRGRP